MEEFNFVGKNLNESRRQEASSKMENERAINPEDKIEHSESDKIYIEKARSLVLKKLQSLDLGDKFSTPEERFNILPRAKYLSEEWLTQICGNYDTENGQIYVYKNTAEQINPIYRTLFTLLSKDTKLNTGLLETLIHEPLHAGSHQKFHVNESGEIKPFRIGYAVLNPEERGGDEYFTGLNEAVVNKMTEDILVESHNPEKQKGREMIERKVFEQSMAYKIQTKIMDKIIDKIAIVKNEPREEVWRRFQRGLFTGEMMHLRDVEKAFGPNSLRILALMDSNQRGKLNNNIYYKYFSTDNQKVRDEISQQILSDLENTNMAA